MGSMYLCDGLVDGKLLSVDYKKYWPVHAQAKDATNNKVNLNLFRPRSKSCGAGTVRERRRKAEFHDSSVVNVGTEKCDGDGGREHSGVKRRVAKKGVDNNNNNNNAENEMDGGVNTTTFSKLDVEEPFSEQQTLHTIGWMSGASPQKKDDPGDAAKELYKFTKAEFRKLQEQVRDVSMNLKNRFRASAYEPPPCVDARSKKLYQRPAGENPAQIYRSQLAASLKAFQQKQWPPLNHAELDPTFIRCKPVTQIHDRPSTSCSSRTGSPQRLQRPRSVPASSLRPTSASTRRSETPADVRPGKFDTLSPTVISDLMGSSERPSSGSSAPSEEKSPLITVLAQETKRLVENDDASTTSGIDSGASDNESPSEDSDSDYEPDIDPSIQIPQLSLRPEKLDAFYIPEPKRGWRQYDFDMTNIDIPPYEFKNPFPEYLENVDLKQMAKLKWNWRNHLRTKTGPRESSMEGMIDRLVEFEKLQLDTIDWENKRSAQLRKTLPRRNIASAKVRDKRCDPNCLQATCFGDCPEKLVQSNTCEICRQSLCTGTCKETKYEQRMRQPRVEEERPITPKPPFPRACSSCQRRHNAKFINANNLILGTSRVNNSTFVRGQSSLKPRDLRPRTPAQLPSDVLVEFEKLNIDTTQVPRPSTSMSVRPRSRNAVFPGKSFSSQRKNSLTDLDKVLTASKKKRNGKPPKSKRPKTAG